MANLPPCPGVETGNGEAHAAIGPEEHQPLRDETTEKDPNHEWAKAELEKQRLICAPCKRVLAQPRAS